MKVVKKLGHREDFNLNKIRTALIRTSNNLDGSFGNDEWKEIKPRIQSRLEPIMGDREEIFFWEIDDVVIDSLLRSRFKDLAREYIETRSKIAKDKLNDLGLSPLAMYLLKKRYLRKDSDGKCIETAKEMLCRVGTTVAHQEKTQELKEEYTEKFNNMLINRDFLPNSPCLVSAGGDRKGTWFACFAYSMEDSLKNIFHILHKTARTFQLGGGVGISIAKLREKGSAISGTGGESSGSVAFLELFDTMCKTVKAGGFRRGALMAINKYNHPDIDWFIHCKKDTSKLNNMNISILVDDNFFKSVEKDEEIELISPLDGSVKDTKSAKLMLEEIATNIWETGEPGLLFYNRINKDNPTPHLGNIELTNPCLTKDTWVFSSDGPRQVKDLINKEITQLMYDGKLYKSEPFFSTGIKDVYEITTNRGYKLKATSNHLIYTYSYYDRYNKVDEWKKVGDLKEGDMIRLSKNRNIVNWTGDGLYWQGYMLGLLVSDGYIDKNSNLGHIKLWETDNGFEGVRDYINSVKNNLDTRSDFKGFSKYKETLNLKYSNLRQLAHRFGITDNKDFKSKLEKTSSMFQQGFISGMFDGDGTVLVNKEKGNSIRLAQNNLKRLEVIQRMLSRFGIASTIYKERNKEEVDLMPDGNGGYKYYNRKPLHELVISKDNMSLFNTYIGFKNTNKSTRLNNLLNDYDRGIYNDNFITYVTNIKHIGKEEVFDTKVDEVHAFDANGILVHNCSESTLLDGEACVLGSINLVNHLNDNDINWDKLSYTTKLATRFLDDLIDGSPFPDKHVEKAVKATRKIGIGVMGFHDCIMKLGVKYSSNKAIDMADKIMSFIEDAADQESKHLAKEKGTYSEWRKEYPKRRNAIVTIQAPTGSISLIAGVSPGIEPNFYKSYSRIIDNSILKVEHPMADSELFETASEITPEQHLKILAKFQEHVENSVSKTINVPENTTVEDIKSLLVMAHKLNVKGVTIFRENCNRDSLIKCEDCKLPGGSDD